MEMTIVDQYTELSEDYQRVEQAIRFLEQNYRRQPELKEVAESIHLSEYHFQRLFTRWVGISPKRFLQFLTKENAKAMLEKGVKPEIEVWHPGNWSLVQNLIDKNLVKPPYMIQLVFGFSSGL